MMPVFASRAVLLIAMALAAITLPAMAQADSDDFQVNEGVLSAMSDGTPQGRAQVLANLKSARDTRRAVLRDCGLSTASRSETTVGRVSDIKNLDGTDDFIPSEVRNHVYKVTRWSGGCENNLRDGFGVLHLTLDISGPKGHIVTLHEVFEANFVGGKLVGMACTQPEHLMEDGKKLPTLFAGCAIPGAPGLWRKEADGRWRLYEFDTPIEPASYLPAGAPEAASEKAVADARAGKTSLPAAAFTVRNELLTDLVRGARIKMAPGMGAPVQLAGKRLGLVLSTRTLAEIERYQPERQALLEATRPAANAPAYLQEDWRKLEKKSDSGMILTTVTRGLNGKAASVVAANDLTILSSGQVDYVVVLDWRFTGSWPRTAAAFAAMPACKAGDAACPRLFTDNLTAYVIDPKMEVVKIVTHSHALSDTKPDEASNYIITANVQYDWDWALDEVGLESWARISLMTF